MTVKMRKIIDALPALRKLSDADLSIKPLYWVNKLISAVEVESKLFDQKKEKIIEKYCIDLGEGKRKIPDDKLEAANAELADALDLDCEVEYKRVIIPLTETIKLSNNDLCALDGFVEIETPEEGEA